MLFIIIIISKFILFGYFETNCLQEFESYIAEKLGCLGPLDALIELATCCRDNSWNDASHHIQHPGKKIERV